MNTKSEMETKGTILLVDDLPENLQLLSDLLLERGYTVRRVTSGKMAIKTLRIKLSDLILLDIKMPEMDGYEVCQTLKADPDFCDIPVIFISALDETFDKVKAFESGGVDYITKPFQIEEVLARVKNQLTIQKQKRALQHEINKRRETEEILYQSRALLASVLNTSLDGIAAMQAIRDPRTGNIEDFRCLVINPILSKALRRSHEQVMGKVVVKRWLNRIAPQLFDRFVAVVETGESLSDDLHYVLGKSCWYHYVAVKLGDGFAITVRDITARKQAEIALQESEKRFSTIFNNSPIPMWIGTLAEGRCLNINNSFCQFLGASREQVLGKTCIELALWNDFEDLKHFRQTLGQEGMIQNFEVVIHLPSGEAKTILLSAKKEKLNGEDCVIGVMKDISDRKQFEKFLYQYARIVAFITDGIALVDCDYHYLIANQTYLQLTSTVNQEIRGRSVMEVLGEEIFQTVIKPRLDRCLAGESLQFEKWLTFKDNNRRFIRVNYSPYIETDGTISGVVVDVHDLTDIKQIEQALQTANQKLELLANLDGLTQVPNRRRFDDYLELEWKRHLREQQPLALIMIDIDYFKNYNDYYGHQKGDNCLSQVAQTLVNMARRATDLVARYGGEEFAVILPNTNTQQALVLAESMREAIAALKIPHLESKIGKTITISLGIASLIPSQENNLEYLIRQADQALFQAKTQGRDRCYADS